MIATEFMSGTRRGRVFTSDAPLSAGEIAALASGDMDEVDSARERLLRAALSRDVVPATVYPGIDPPEALHVYVAEPGGTPLFACVLVTEQHVHSMLRESPRVVEGFTLQVAQGTRMTGAALRAALETWGSRNFPDVSAPVFGIEEWIEPPPSLPEFWEPDASVPDPPFRHAA